MPVKEASPLLPVLEAVVSYIDEGVLVADGDGTLIYQNPAAGALLGLPTERPVTRLRQVGKLNLHKTLLRAAIDQGEVDAAGRPSGRFVTFEQVITIGGSVRHLEFSSGLVPSPNGKVRWRLILIRDRSEHRRLEEVFNRGEAPLQTNDPRMLEILDRIHQIAPTRASVLLQGESGTGKTELARSIHRLSRRGSGPFVELNCAAIPESLLESELFGHVRGAFTGANQERAGRFQTAHRGTLLLDEVGEIPLHLQAKLLRAIQDQEFEMVGSDRPVRVDVRIIAASNQTLRDMVDAGEFRADLYYRLAVIPITVPSLRERPGDIPLLIRYFCDQLAKRGYAENYQCTPQALRMLMDYPWPGNVRELENAIEHGIICASGALVTEQSLPQHVREYYVESRAAAPPDDAEHRRQRQRIQDALAMAHGSKTEAARLLGIDRTTLWRRMQRLGLT